MRLEMKEDFFGTACLSSCRWQLFCFVYRDLRLFFSFMPFNFFEESSRSFARKKATLRTTCCHQNPEEVKKRPHVAQADQVCFLWKKQQRNVRTLFTLALSLHTSVRPSSLPVYPCCSLCCCKSAAFLKEKIDDAVDNWLCKGNVCEKKRYDLEELLLLKKYQKVPPRSFLY